MNTPSQSNHPTQVTLGCVTIGQAPRVDVIPDLAAVLGPQVRIVEAGAMDGLTLAQVADFAPRPGNSVVASRMADGTAIAMGKENIFERVQLAVTRVAELGSTAILLLCTGKFPAFRTTIPVYTPDRLLHGAVDGLVDSGQRLGVLCPTPEQMAYAPTKWQAPGRQVVVVSASPYRGDERFLAEARQLMALEPDVVLMDCMGYRGSHKAALAQLFAGKPLILANTAAVRLLAEVL